jgi:hypothetical protein
MEGNAARAFRPRLPVDADHLDATDEPLRYEPALSPGDPCDEYPLHRGRGC